MLPFNELCRSQFSIYDGMKKLQENIRKEGSRRTLEYLKNKTTTINEYWDEFNKTDDDIRNHEDVDPSCDYLHNDVYQAAEKLYDAIIFKIKEYEELIISNSNAVSNAKSNESSAITSISKEQSIRLKKQMIKIKQLKKHINQIKLTQGVNHPKTFWKQKQKNLEEMWSAITNLHEDIEAFAEPQDYDDDYFTNGEFEETEELLEKTLLKLQIDEEQRIQKNEDEANIQLPRVTIPQFEGNYHTWPTFHDLYMRLIHTNKKISKVEKMQYLKLQLTGEAAKLIQHLLTSEVNYETAWETIVNRYNNKRLIIATQLDKFLNQSQIVTESARALKQLHDTTRETIHAIENMGVETNGWGPIMVHLITKKMDRDSYKLYEQSLKSPKEIQDLDDLLTFLEMRFQSLEAMGETKYKNVSQPTSNEQRNKWKPTSHITKTNEVKCPFCQEDHTIFNCKKFQLLEQKQRYEAVKQRKLCINCLTHKSDQQCYSTKRCMKCSYRHHTLLHFDNIGGTMPNKKANTYTSMVTKEGEENQVVANIGEVQNVLLATALVRAKNSCGQYEYVRALIDPGSQASFITIHTAEILSLPLFKTATEVTGLGVTNAGTSIHKVHIEFTARFPTKTTIQNEFLVMPKITKTLPSNNTSTIDKKYWKNYLLADPTFNIPGPIDMLIGADIYGELLLEGIHKLNTGLVAQNTALGWIFFGKKHIPVKSNSEVTSMISVTKLENQLSKFWEIEEPPSVPTHSEENKICEEYYENSHVRNEDGSYTVTIPFKPEINLLGESRKKAMARFLQLERRFRLDSKLKEDYHNFINEYISLNHMRLIITAEQNNESCYYIPHQAVLKEESSTTKLRVVFDASAKTTSGKSLNDMMYTGPKLQQDLVNTLLRWRKHQFVFTADVEKMYRQIKICTDQQDYQRILWRPSENKPIEEYKLTTVTYGTASAPYLAIRTLQQLARDESENYPIASKIALRDFYVDDLMSGADSLEEAITLQKQLISLLDAGRFNLRKWTSNSKEILEEIPEELVETGIRNLTDEKTIKTLGIQWNPTLDTFTFSVKANLNGKITKRTILSDIARLYDPLGWLAPVMIKAKLIMQDLWISGEKWDEPISTELSVKWVKFITNLTAVIDINIPRWINFTENSLRVELHGFCDASEKAYGCVIYSRVIEKSGNIKITLLTAKSKVAPLKTKKTLPRLELCGAVLLSKMMKCTIGALELKSASTYAWSDSTITLAWIQGCPTKWNNFVANRVAQVHSAIGTGCWRHVRSEDNPADAVSRGLEANQLNDLWWQGPSWLKDAKDAWKNLDSAKFNTNQETKKSNIVSCVLTTTSDAINLLDRFSSLNRLIRVLSYCKRIARKEHTDELNTKEMINTLDAAIKIVQEKFFTKEINELKSTGVVNSKSTILSLQPIIGRDGLLRVGGRLTNSSLSYNEKHPIILPKKSHFTRLIVEDAHRNTLHGGNTLTRAFIRRKYWIPDARSCIRDIIKKCVKCSRLSAQPAHQLMGNLPAGRVTPSRPFTHTGIDYAGPINIRVSKGRGNKSYKGYISVFVCFSTKAIHIEAVSDMTSEAFLAAFKRFTARRGICSHIYSDNGTTFVGAQKLLINTVQISMKPIVEELANKGTQWHFIPPAAPHFGGLWEAGVKSIKYHLKRVIGESTLTFEELSTVLCQIEACLNSRPLCQLTSDPFDYSVITPGHFLIGTSLLNPLVTETNEIPINLTKRWNLVKKMSKDFWTNWRNDHLYHLQQRPKWKLPQKNLEVGDLVLLKEDNYPQTQWPLARITNVHPGSDDKIRVVTIKLKNNSELKRPITKVCPLPMNEKETHNEDTTTLPRKHAKSSNGMMFTNAMMMFLVVFGTIVDTAIASKFTIKKPDAGLYVEQLGSAHLKRGSLRVETSISLKDITMDTIDTQNVVTRTRQVCDKIRKISPNNHCPELISQLVLCQDELKTHIEFILESNHVRVKRGLLGNLLQSVFGVNDEVYTDIDKLNKNQHNLILTSNHQTSIMLSTLAEINDTDVRIAEQLNKFAKRMNTGMEIIDKMQQWHTTVDENKLNIQMLTAYQLAKNYLDDVSTKYQKIADAVFKRGNIFDFLTSLQVNKILKSAKTKIPQNLIILPTPIDSLDITFSQDNIYIRGYFHITEINKFQILQITPIPKKISNATFLIIDTPTTLLAIDYDNQLYFETTDEELKASMKINDETYLCTPTITHSIDKKHICIIDELFHRKYENQCNLHQLKLTSIIWKQLRKANTWLFITNKPTRIAIICNGVRNETWVNNTGIIHINHECSIQSQDSILKSTIQQQISVTSTFNKPINFTMQTLIPLSRVHNMLPDAVLGPTQHFSSIVNEEKDLKDNSHSTNWETIQPHSFGVPLGFIIIFFVLSIGGAIVIYQIRKRREPSSSHSSPGEDVETAV